MSVDITKTSEGDKIEETRSYYGPSMALLRLAILPPLPCFQLSGHGRPQLYADAYNSGLLALYCFPPGLLPPTPPHHPRPFPPAPLA